MRNLGFLKQRLPAFPESFIVREKISDETLATIETTLTVRLEREKVAVPLNLGFEMNYNPFLRAENFAEFEAIRKLRNQF
jgi:hypothetical protein